MSHPNAHIRFNESRFLRITFGYLNVKPICDYRPLKPITFGQGRILVMRVIGLGHSQT